MSDNRGRFTWYELMTTDVDAGIEFYRSFIDWGRMKWEGGPVPYQMFTIGEAPVAGAMELPEDARAAGAPPHWLGYVHTDDLDATLAQATELGATVLTQIDLPDVGRVGVISDPQQAVFCAFQPANDPGPETEPCPGQFTWHELMTDDYEAAFEFYSALFGWELMQDMDMGEPGVYRIFGRNGKQTGGMFNRPEGVPCCWIYYVTVADLDAAAAAITAGGGTIIHGPMDVPGGDRIVQAMDPQGGTFALHWRNPEQAGTAQDS